MVKNPELLEQAELEYEREHPLTLEERFNLFEEMYQLALEFSGGHPIMAEDDLEQTVALAKALHANIPTTPRAHRKSTGGR